MARTVANAVQSREVRSLDGIRLSPAKASYESPTESTGVEHGLLDRLARTVESALIDAHGSQKAAAIEIDIDQSQMKRQLRLGTFDLRQQAAAGEVFLAKLGERLTEEFGAARKSPQQQARERIPVLISELLALTEESR